MKETKFIEQNKEKWVNFENITRLNIKDPDKLSDLFVQITDDLSYSRTFYPNRFISLYLNHLCQQLFYNIYKNRRARLGQFLNFWQEELPYVVFQARKELLLSLFTFLLAAGIGVISSYNDPEFVRVIMGDGYVDMTLENIEKGDPMAVYKKANQVDMFLGISLNNLLVSFYTFILGIVFSIGAVFRILYNGIMVGAFQYFFIEKGVFLESFLTIWLHGTIEISCIIIAGGSGILLGKGLVFPGTHSRLKAFQLSARRGVKLFLGIAPLIVFAAIIESFFTRYTEIPDVIRAIVIFLSAFFIVAYFVWYPYYKSRVGFQVTDYGQKLIPKTQVKIEFEGKIKTVNEVFADTVYIFRSIFRKYRKYFFGIISLYVISAYFIIFSDIDNYVTLSLGYRLLYHVDHSASPEIFFLNTLYTIVIVWFMMRELTKRIPGYIPNPMQSMWQSALLILGLDLTFFAYDWWLLPIFGLCVPLVFLGIGVVYVEKIPISQLIPRCIKILSNNLVNFLGLNLLVFFLAAAFLFFLQSPEVFFSATYEQFILMNLPENFLTKYQLTVIFSSFSFILGLLFIIPVYIIAFTLQYFSFKEINEATGLRKKVLAMIEE